MKRGLLVLLVVAVLGAMQGWNISRAQTPDDGNASEFRQFYSDVTLSSGLYTVTPEDNIMFPPEGGKCNVFLAWTYGYGMASGYQ